MTVISKYVELTFWRIDIIKSSYINDCPTTIGETDENHFFDSHLIGLTFWRIDIIKSSYINDCPTTIGETVENYFCQVSLLSRKGSQTF